MKNLLFAALFLFAFASSFSQNAKIKADKYPSLLWEIKGKNGKSSYLFGTMHVSSKMVFHLSDSFYNAIQNAQVVALETNPGNWQEDFSRYDLEGESFRRNMSRYYGGYGLARSTAPDDYLTINSLRLSPFEKKLEASLYSSPSIINSFLYRSSSEAASDFEEDTYLDLHIFQTGRKLGKRICGVEDFDGSMRLVKEAYVDAAKEKKKSRSYDYDDDFSYAHMEEAYRTGNLDLLDTINKTNSQSAAFDEKFLYKRNEIQARSIDSILRSGAVLFVGVGAAHLPGERGVIELLRQKGYKLRPIKMTERNSLQKERLERIRVPVQFTKQFAEDGFYSVSVPGRLHNFNRRPIYHRFGQDDGGTDVLQYADMTNGSYYMVTRIFTNAAVMGQSEVQVERKIDSVLYENVPGKILSKRSIVKNGYRGYDIVNRTRRGDVQRYNIFITPFEVILFKMSGNGNYVKGGTEAEQFFGSIQLKETKLEWKNWSPANGGFQAEWPQQPTLFNDDNWVYGAYDAESKTAFEVIRTDVHNYNFLEEDSFDLNLMEESFASSDCIARSLSRQQTKLAGYPALDVMYRYKDSSIAMVRFVIQGPHYYTVVANAKTANASMNRFLKSFAIKPFRYSDSKEQKDTALQYRVLSPVALEKKEKLQMYPTDVYGIGNDADDSLLDNGNYKSKLVVFDSTGEKILVSFYKPSQYFFRDKKDDDSIAFKKEWVIRREKRDTLSNGTTVHEYDLGSRESSRMLRGKVFSKRGVDYTLQTMTDTLSSPSLFVSSFFQHFIPLDSSASADAKKKKADLFFSNFFSSDTMLHKKAVRNINWLVVDSSDFKNVKQSIESLTWREKKYLSAKRDFTEKLAYIKTKEASDYLKELYYKAGDTVELQYGILETLLGQQTAYAYQTFAQIMQTDPPVLDVDMVTSDSYADAVDATVTGYKRLQRRETYDLLPPNVVSGRNPFFNHLTDSLALTAGIFKTILPLINVNDYERPIMNLMRILVDSNYLRPADYEFYLPKFILEAKQVLKKQLIQEKSKAIAKAQKEGDAERLGQDYEVASDFGNSNLELYITLILPFWQQNPQVPQIMNWLLQSDDRRIKYNTALLLLRNHQSVSDTVWNYFAKLDDFRYELYTDLKKLNRVDLFPNTFKSQLQLAQSKLLSSISYIKVDTLVYLKKLLLQDKEKKGSIYFFKYKRFKEDNAWKLATAGLMPEDSTQMIFDTTEPNEAERDANDFTELSDIKLSADTSESEQLEKLRKKLLYSRRKSGAQFYADEARYNGFDYMRSP